MAQTLSEMPDELVTALLAANFDAASLANRLADHGVRASADCARLFSYAQCSLRAQPRLARSLSAFLDRMHAERIAEVQASELDLLKTWAVAADWTRCRDSRARAASAATRSGASLPRLESAACSCRPRASSTFTFTSSRGNS